MKLMILQASAVVVILACSLAMARAAERVKVANQQAKTFNFRKVQEGRTGYLLYLPQGYKENDDRKWPLILFLHGAGERGDDINLVGVHGPPKLVSAGTNLPFIVVSPQCARGKRWENEPLLGLLDEIVKSYRVDTSRVYLTGISMGGYGTWNLGCSYPERFAAIVPICGGGEKISVLLTSREKSQALKTLGVWAFHGAKDPVVPLEESERMVEALKRAGVEGVRLTVYPEAQHDSWTQTYENPEVFEWLLKHQRK